MSPFVDTFPDGATPFGAFPSIAAVPRHRGRYPLVVRPRFDHQVPCVATQCWSSPRGRRPQGLAPQPSPLPRSGVSTRSPPDAPLGFRSPRRLAGHSLQSSGEGCWQSRVSAESERNGGSTSLPGEHLLWLRFTSVGRNLLCTPPSRSAFYPEAVSRPVCRGACSWSVEFASFVTPGRLQNLPKQALSLPFARKRRAASCQLSSQQSFATLAWHRSAGPGDEPKRGNPLTILTSTVPKHCGFLHCRFAGAVGWAFLWSSSRSSMLSKCLLGSTCFSALAHLRVQKQPRVCRSR
jgi:hypothetical protein